VTIASPPSTSPRLQIVIASTRPQRVGPAIAGWFLAQAERHEKFEVELVDLAQVNLPMFDEPRHPRLRQYEHEHTKAWSQIVDRADAYVFVTPEYDHGPPPSLVNALDYLVHEWAYKAVGFVSYGGVSAGVRSVAMTKEIVTALKMMPMFESVALPFFAQHLDKEKNVFAPPKVQDDAATVMLNELLKWTIALRGMRVS
jgi:NAD(P)H-dependent FMN reductase